MLCPYQFLRPDSLGAGGGGGEIVGGWFGVFLDDGDAGAGCKKKRTMEQKRT